MQMSITDNFDPFNAFVLNKSINILKENLHFEWKTLMHIFFNGFDEK